MNLDSTDYEGRFHEKNMDEREGTIIRSQSGNRTKDHQDIRRRSDKIKANVKALLNDTDIPLISALKGLVHRLNLEHNCAGEFSEIVASVMSAVTMHVDVFDHRTPSQLMILHSPENGSAAALNGNTCNRRGEHHSGQIEELLDIILANYQSCDGKEGIMEALIRPELFLTAVRNDDLETAKVFVNITTNEQRQKRARNGHQRDEMHRMTSNPLKTAFQLQWLFNRFIGHFVWLEAIWIAKNQRYDKMLKLLLRDDRITGADDEEHFDTNEVELAPNKHRYCLHDEGRQTFLRVALNEYLTTELDDFILLQKMSIFLDFDASYSWMGKILEIACEATPVPSASPRETFCIRIEALLRVLIERGVDLNRRNRKGNTSLMIACERGCTETVHSLLRFARTYGISLDFGATDVFGETAKAKAKRRNDRSMVAAVEKSEFLAAVEDGDEDLVRTILENGFDESTKSQSIMSDSHNTETRTQTECGVDIDSWIEAVQTSIENSSRNILEILLNYDVIVQSQEAFRGDSLLHRIFERSRDGGRRLLRLTQALLRSENVNINALNFKSETVLHSVLKSCHRERRCSCHRDHGDAFYEAIRLFFSNGINANCRNNAGRTPLIIVCLVGCTSAAETMLRWAEDADTQLDLNAQDLYGRTALITAVIQGHSGIVEMLLGAGAAVNASDRLGFTALHHALCKAFISAKPSMFYPRERNDWVDLDNFPRDLEELGKMKEINSTLFQNDSTDRSRDKIASELEEDRMKIVVQLLVRPDVDVNALQFNGFSPLDIVTASDCDIHPSIMEAFEEREAILNVYRQRTRQSSSDCELEVGCVAFVLCRFAIADLSSERQSENVKQLEILGERFSKLSETVRKEMISATDRKQRTALHSAVIAHDTEYIFQNETDEKLRIVELLLSLGCDVNAVDIYGCTPLHYVKHRQVRRLLLSSGADSAIKNKCGISEMKMVEDSRRQRHTPVTYRVSEEIKKAFHRIDKTFSTSDNSGLAIQSSGFYGNGLMPPWCRHLNPRVIVDRVWREGEMAFRHPLIGAITQEVRQIVSDLSAEIKRRDSRFEVRPVLVGSAYEGTRLDLPDEFDFILILSKFSQMCQVHASPELPTGFVHLRRKPSEGEAEGRGGEFDGFFTADGILITEKVIEQFRMILANVATYVGSRRNYSWNWHFCSFNGLVFSPASTLEMRKLRFGDEEDRSGSVEAISLDIVPCFHIDSWWPDDALSNVSETVKSSGCILVFDRPQRKYNWVPYSESCVRISFSPAESEMIKHAGSTAKQAYMIGKRLLKYAQCPPSYILKNSLLYCIEAFRAADIAGEMSVYQWLDVLLSCQLGFVLRDLCPIYFMPTFHLPIKGHQRWTAHGAGFPESCLKSYKLYRVVSMDPLKCCLPAPKPGSFFQHFDRDQLIKEAAMKMSEGDLHAVVEFGHEDCDDDCEDAFADRSSSPSAIAEAKEAESTSSNENDDYEVIFRR